jgi:hypothetical protein
MMNQVNTLFTPFVGDESKESETDKFFNKYDSIQTLKQSNQELLSFILDSIGEDYGAIDSLFNRFENEVVGLPNKGKIKVEGIEFFYPNFPLRLYAFRINDRKDLVVLFNGGIKSAQTNQKSGDLHIKWLEACQFAKRIEEAIREKEIIIDTSKRMIFSEDGEAEILL